MNFKFIKYFFLILMPIELFAGLDTVKVFNTDQSITLTDQVAYYIDNDSRYSFDWVLEEHRKGNFFDLGSKVANFTKVSGTIWFRIIIENNVSQPLYISLNNIFIEDFTVYTIHSNNQVKMKSTGYLHPFNTRDVLTGNYSLMINENNDSLVEVFGSMKSNIKTPKHVLLRVGTMKAIVADSRNSEFISIGIIGILLIMFFYNLSLFFVIRESLYLYYCLYIVSAVLIVMWFSGFMFERFWPDSPHLNPYPWQMGIFYFCQALFLNKMLKVRDTFPKVYLVSYLIYFLSVLVIFSVWLPHHVPIFLLMVLGIIGPFYFLLSGVLSTVQRNPVSYVFFLGWSPLFVVSILNVFMISDVLEYNIFFDTHAVEFSLAWEVIIFSLAFGYRYNHIRKEKLEIQAENIRIINDQKSILKQKVLERTEEIMAQNDQLVSNQEYIKLQNERLEAQNKAYERLKELILRQNQELEAAVEKRTNQLAESNKELKKRLHQLEQFSFIAAHNLRAPVARILGLSSIFKYDMNHHSENIGILEKVTEASKELDEVIHDLEAIIEVQKNTNEKYEAIDVESLTSRIIEKFNTEIESENIRFNLEIGTASITAIPTYMDSILTNIVSNSLKYRNENRETFIVIRFTDDSSFYNIVIEDNGIGFDSKMYSRKLFEPFQRFHPHITGKGLSMFFVKTQVTAMNGRIQLESEPDRGTKVEINLPKN